MGGYFLRHVPSLIYTPGSVSKKCQTSLQPRHFRPTSCPPEATGQAPQPPRAGRQLIWVHFASRALPGTWLFDSFRRPNSPKKLSPLTGCYLTVRPSCKGEASPTAFGAPNARPTDRASAPWASPPGAGGAGAAPGTLEMSGGELPPSSPDPKTQKKEGSSDIPNTMRCSFQCSHHPAALAEPRGTLVEPWWNPGGTLVEPSWNPRGTLPQPRTTPEPIWAETPKLPAVGEKS